MLVAATMVIPASKLGTEFMPELDEGDLMYMPSLEPGASIDKVRAFLQQTDRLIASVPEVEQVFGKAGRADTATDPAPLGMLETVIRFKPQEEWREGMTKQDIIRELDQAVQFPGVANVWVPPIKTRIDMLATGIRSPVGSRLPGPIWARSNASASRWKRHWSTSRVRHRPTPIGPPPVVTWRWTSTARARRATGSA